MGRGGLVTGGAKGHRLVMRHFRVQVTRILEFDLEDEDAHGAIETAVLADPKEVNCVELRVEVLEKT